MNVYIPPNLRKKIVSDEQVQDNEAVIIPNKVNEDISAGTNEVVSTRIAEVVPSRADDLVPDRAADGSELIETTIVEGLDDIRTDPDGQSSEPEVGKDQPITEEDKNDSGFIECGKNSSDKSDYSYSE